MSKETIKANENVQDINKELNELRESNLNLIDERATLMEQNEELKKKLEDALNDKSLVYKYWAKEQNKVKMLVAFINAGISSTEYMSAGRFVETIVEKM